jgi:phage shock protein A
MEVEAEIARKPYVPAGAVGSYTPVDVAKQAKVDEQLNLLKEKLNGKEAE